VALARSTRRLSGGIGDPNRTSFELQLNSETAIWLAGASLANVQRTVNGRPTDARRTVQTALGATVDVFLTR